MTGFLRGLFGGNSNNQPNKPEAKRKPQQQGSAFFLEPDAAKTLGDVDFMRKPFEIKHTFPKVRDQPGFSIEKQVRAMDEADSTSASNSSSASSLPPDSSAPSFTPRRRDDSMDLFRKMAKDLKR